MDKLPGRRVLILEDEFLIADEMASIIVRAGSSVEGPHHFVKDAERAIQRGNFDLAVLDVRLQGQDSFAMAGSLAERGVPFVFATGYDERHLPGRWRHVPRCSKPVEPRSLVEMLACVAERDRDFTHHYGCGLDESPCLMEG